MWHLLLASSVQAAPLDDVVAAFEAHTGARLVFAAEDLPEGAWFDVLQPLPADERLRAAQIALDEARRYPPGYLRDVGLRTVGLFGGLASHRDDGYHAWDESLGGYAYYGLYNGSDALIAAAYTERQLPLTIHHEVFHAVDAASGHAADDVRFARAVAGTEPYPAPVLSADDLAALRAARRYDGPVLEGAVGAYTAKSRGEDQAETARHLLAFLPDALLQVVERPDLPGSQRMLHVLAEYEAVPGGPTFEHWVDDALGRHRFRDRAREVARWEGVFRPEGRYVVHGAEDAEGVNWTLRAQVASFGAEAASLADLAPLGDPAVVREELRQLALLADYHAFIASRWEVTPGTRASFDAARLAMVATLPDGPLASALEAATLEDLAAVLDPAGADPAGVIAALAARGVPVNDPIAKVDDKIPDPAVRAAIRRVQPATVRVTTGSGTGSGVNLASDGLVLTAAHVPDALGAEVVVSFPDGSRFAGTCVAIDARLDLALIDLAATGLPWAPVAPSAPEEGDPVVVIGQPGDHAPGGGRTGYEPFHVSVGEIRGFLDDPLDDQRLGRTKHDAWTYWGHSGSPLFDRHGRVVAMHNSWDPDTAMRHAVTWEAIDRFLADPR